jgi:hypothetical protein
VADFCIFYHVPIIEYNKVLTMSHRVFFAMNEHKSKVLKAEQEGWQRALTGKNGKR